LGNRWQAAVEEFQPYAERNRNANRIEILAGGATQGSERGDGNDR